MQYLPRLTILVVVLMLSACINKAAIRPPDVLNDRAGHAVIVFSTSSVTQSLSFAVAINLYSVGDNGELQPVPGDRAVLGYYVDNPYHKFDIAPELANLMWRTVPPGRYRISVGHFNGYQCLESAPTYDFTVSADQIVYLGDFHRDGSTLELINNYARDIDYFRTHADNASTVPITTAKVYITNVEYGCQWDPVHGVIPLIVRINLADPNGSPSGGQQ